VPSYNMAYTVCMLHIKENHESIGFEQDLQI
jgi:hypothetical protein